MDELIAFLIEKGFEWRETVSGESLREWLIRDFHPNRKEEYDKLLSFLLENGFRRHEATYREALRGWPTREYAVSHEKAHRLAVGARLSTVRFCAWKEAQPQ